MAIFKHPVTGQIQTAHSPAVERFLRSRGYELHSATEGPPSEDWTNTALVEFSEAHGIDLTGATKKADYLERIAAAAATEPLNPSQDNTPPPEGAN